MKKVEKFGAQHWQKLWLMMHRMLQQKRQLERQHLEKDKFRGSQANVPNPVVSPYLRVLSKLKASYYSDLLSAADQKTTYKILMYAFKALHSLTLDYVTELLKIYISGRCLRSSSVDAAWFNVPKTKKLAGEAAFFTAAPLLWNALPKTVRPTETIAGFKKHLKTLLFVQCYSA